jgi:hypothetical protein
MRDVTSKLVGAALLCGSGASTLLHRNAFVAARGGPAGLGEVAFGLLTFFLASTGILLLIHGRALFRRPERKPVDGVRRHPVFTAPLPLNEALDSRYGVALVLAHRAIAAARSSRPAALGEQVAPPGPLR